MDGSIYERNKLPPINFKTVQKDEPSEIILNAYWKNMIYQISLFLIISWLFKWTSFFPAPEIFSFFLPPFSSAPSRRNYWNIRLKIWTIRYSLLTSFLLTPVPAWYWFSEDYRRCSNLGVVFLAVLADWALCRPPPYFRWAAPLSSFSTEPDWLG